MEKKLYSRPFASIERFVPNHYCEYCFQYTIILHCNIGNPNNPSQQVVEPGAASNDVHQYQYCGTNRITVTITDGVPTYVGYENMTHEDETRPMDVNYVRDVTPDILTLEAGDAITNARWQSEYRNINFNHHGPGEVVSKDLTWEGHPNHS